MMCAVVPCEPNSKATVVVSHSEHLCDSDDEAKARQLLEKQETQRLKKPISEFWRRKYERESKRYWDLFYKRNSDHFFKDRHYLLHEVPEIEALWHTRAERSEGRVRVLEVGCGVGNALLPVLSQFCTKMDFIALDISPRAIEMISAKANAIIRAHTAALQSVSCPLSMGSGIGTDKLLTVGQMHTSAKPKTADFSTLTADVCDVMTQSIELFAPYKADFGILLFVLSSIEPSSHLPVVLKLADALAFGGLLYLRDYALYDLAQLRFKGTSKLCAHIPYYVRGDGTTAYYFTTEGIRRMLAAVNAKRKDYRLEVDSAVYCKKTVVNRKTKAKMNRVWIQCKIRKQRVEAAADLDSATEPHHCDSISDRVVLSDDVVTKME